MIWVFAKPDYSTKYGNNYILKFESVGLNKILSRVSHWDNNIEHLTDNLSTYIGNPITLTCQACNSRLNRPKKNSNECY